MAWTWQLTADTAIGATGTDCAMITVCPRSFVAWTISVCVPDTAGVQVRSISCDNAPVAKVWLVMSLPSSNSLIPLMPTLSLADTCTRKG